MKALICIGLTASLLTACGGGGDSIATVNGKAIQAADFEAYIEHKRIAIRSDEQKDKVLDQYLAREALANLIESEHLKDNAVVLAEINELKKEIIISRYFEGYLKEQVTEQAITNYYNSNIDKYEDKKVQVAHILLRLNRNMDETQRRVKLTTAQEAYSKVQAGMDFAEAADKYSEDGVSAKKGGDLGWLVEGSIHKKFSEQAFTLKQGEISEPIETPYGYHIIKVLEEAKISRKSFDVVKGEIRYQLRNAAKNSERNRLLEAVKIEKG